MNRCQEPEDAFHVSDVFVYWLQEKPSLTFSFCMIPRWAHEGVPCQWACDDYPLPAGVQCPNRCQPQWYVEGLSGCAVCWDLWGNDCNCSCSEVHHV